MRPSEKRTLAVRLLLFAGVACVGVGAFAGGAAATSDAILSGADLAFAARVDSYGTVLDDLMGNFFEVVHVTAFYVGLSALMIGVVISFLGSRRSDRSLLGYSIGTGGAFLLLLYYGYDILFGLLRWTFKVGTW